MCGIAGYITHHPQSVLSEWADATCGRIAYRGPDGALVGSWSGGPCVVGKNADPNASTVLVHRRLSIIDLSEAASQPMVSADGRFALAFNGEIYNYLDLRACLERDFGRAFRTNSDAEVLLQSWEQWGVDCLPRLIGMFAFAVLDCVSQTVTLARDPVGIKPLCTARTEAGFSFCSEPAPLLDWPGVTRRSDPQGVVDYLRFGFTDHLPSTMFQDIRQLKPGTWLTLDARTGADAASGVFWTPEVRDEYSGTKQQAAAELRELLCASVEMHLRSDVPVASCLSGGIDSSSIVCLMRHVSGTQTDIHTFSHIAPGTPFDEQQWMDLVVEQTGAVPHKVESSQDDLLRDLPNLVRTQQEPFSTTSIYAQYRVMQRLHEAGLKVTLDGQGADELFGGYGFHIGARIGSLLRGDHWPQAFALAAKAGRLPGQSFRSHVSNALDYTLSPSARSLVRKGAGKDAVPGWLSAHWCADQSVWPHPYRDTAGDEVLKQALVRSLRGPGLPHLLRYEDRNSMAWSIESRVPFLSGPLMEFALGLPEEYLIGPQGQTKALLRDAMRGIVPDKILDRTDKVAFQTPEADWMRRDGGLLTAALTECAELLPFLNIENAQQKWDRFLAGAEPYSPAFWRWANMAAWTREFGVTHPA